MSACGFLPFFWSVLYLILSFCLLILWFVCLRCSPLLSAPARISSPPAAVSVRSDAVEINAADPVSCRIRDKIHHVADSFPQATGGSLPWLHALSLKADSAAFQIIVTEHTAQYIILLVLSASCFLLLYFHTLFLLAGGGADNENKCDVSFRFCRHLQPVAC